MMVFAKELDDKLRRFSARAESGSLTLSQPVLQLEDVGKTRH